MRKLYTNLVTDKRTTRLIRVVYLLADASDMLSIDDLAKELNITKKTLKNDLCYLEDFFPTIHGCIKVKKETILLDRNSEVTIEEVLSKLLNKQPLFVLLKALLEGENDSIENWCERIWLSERTLRRYLPKLRKVLKSYNLTLKLSPVLSLDGNENDIRYLYFDYMSQSGWHEEDLLIDKTIQQFHDISYRNYSVVLPIDNNRVKIWLYVLVQRVKSENYTLNTLKKTDPLLMNEHFTIFSKLFNKVMEEYFEIKNIPFSESVYAYILLLETVIYASPMGKKNESEKRVALTYGQNRKEQIIFKEVRLFDPEQFSEINKIANSLLENISLLSLLTPLYQSNSYELNKYTQEQFPKLYDECLKKISTITLSHQAKMVYPKEIATKLTLLLSPYLSDTPVAKHRKILFNITGESCYIIHLFSLLKKSVPSNFDILCVFDEKITDAYIENENIDFMIHNDVMIKPIQACPLIKISHFPSKGEIDQLKTKLFEL